jgi:hypothetical protein
VAAERGILERRVRSRLGLLVGLVLGALLLAPLFGPGYVLVRDMVFVPRAPLGRQLLGIDGVPRGTPSDLLVAVGSRVLPGGWLQDLVLLAIVVGGAWGAARLAPTASRSGAVAAATAYGWSPFLHERLLLGQWALLVGWAVLPWAVRAALEWRQGGPACWPLASLSIAALGGASALVLVGLAVVVCGRPVRALAATAVLSLPWALPAALQDLPSGDPAGVRAFAANSDTPFGVLGSLLTGGGVWNADAVPRGRSGGAFLALLVLVVAVAGGPRLVSRLGRQPLILAAISFVLTLLGSAAPTRSAMEWAVVHVPATGLLRDGQKFAAPVALLVAVAFGCGTEAMLARTGERRIAGVLGALLAVMPVVALAGAAWGEGGRLQSSDYPTGFLTTVRQAHGTVVVLPWSLYRRFPWSGDQPVLDPATKLLRRPVVNDGLPLADGTVRGEDPLARRLDAALRSGQPLAPALRAAGVDEVLVEPTTDGYDATLASDQVRGLTLVSRGTDAVLYDVPGPRSHRMSEAPLVPVVVGDLTAVLLAGFVLMRVVRFPRAGTPPA